VTERAAHLVELDGEWSLWRDVLVRGAGFRISDLLQLADPDRARIAGLVAAIARDPRFREALLWQNRGAAHVIARVDATATVPTSKERRRQQLVARYLQRYCAKNETIGFFGPTGWGTIGGDAPITVQPGSALVRSRAVFFEQWCIDALAGVLAGERELLLEVAPRLMPTVRLDGCVVHYGVTGNTEVPAAVARLLAACTGERTARELAADATLGFPSASAAYDLLDELAERELVIWTIEVPGGLPHPERRLRERLGGMPPSPARERALGAVDRLATARDAVAQATGPDHLDQALGELERVFTELTGTAASRRPGEMYAGRTLVYLDCQRDLELRVGRPLVEQLAALLVPILSAARWYTFEIARRYRELCERTYLELGGGALDYLALWQHLKPHFGDGPTERTPIVDAVVSELVARWRGVLGIDGTPWQKVTMRPGVLAERAAGVFDAPCAGWPSARHLSPDILIAARDVRAVEGGDFQLVLGELHVGNTLASFIDQHPDPARVIAWADDDLGVARVVPVDPTHAVTPRVDQTSRSLADYHIELGPSPSWRPRARVLRAKDLRVEHDGQSLEVVDREHGLRFDIIAFLDQYLTLASSAHFRLTGDDSYVPRVVADRAVLVRMQWRLTEAQFAFARTEDPAERFARAQRWRSEHGFPRWVFARVPQERKPIFVDFDSPIFVDELAKLLRASQRVTISEMVPDPTQAWLPDADGGRYTSELRLVAVDARPWLRTSTTA